MMVGLEWFFLFPFFVVKDMICWVLLGLDRGSSKHRDGRDI